jgi:hypothetical protein
VQQNEQDIIRERCLKFVTAKMQVWLEGGHLTREVEDVVFEEARKCCPDLNANEFLLLMSIVNQTKLAKTVSGQQVSSTPVKIEKRKKMTSSFVIVFPFLYFEGVS